MRVRFWSLFVTGLLAVGCSSPVSLEWTADEYESVLDFCTVASDGNAAICPELLRILEEEETCTPVAAIQIIGRMFQLVANDVSTEELTEASIRRIDEHAAVGDCRRGSGEQ